MSYGDKTDEQAFIALNDDAKLTTKDAVVRSTFGDLRPVIMTTGDKVSRTFVYPSLGGGSDCRRGSEKLEDDSRWILVRAGDG